MIYQLEINRRVVDPYNEDGEWMDGDVREVYASSPEVHTVTTDELDDEKLSLEMWVYSIIGDKWEPNSYPLNVANMGERAWMSQSDSYSPYTTEMQESTVTLTGDWTPDERLTVFRLVANDV